MKSFRNLGLQLTFCLIFQVCCQAQFWERTYGSSADEWAKSVIELNNGDFLLDINTGFRQSELLRINPTGAIVNNDTLGDHWCKHLKKMANGDFMIFGSNQGSPNPQPFLRRYDDTGSELWTQYYPDTLEFDPGFPAWSVTAVTDFVELDDGSLLFLLKYGPVDIPNWYYFFKVTANGDIIWSRELDPNMAQQRQYASALEKSNDGNVFVLPITPNDNNELTKIDTASNVLWSFLLTDNLDGAKTSFLADGPGGCAVSFLGGGVVIADVSGSEIAVDDFEQFINTVYPTSLTEGLNGELIYTGYAREFINSDTHDFFLRTPFPSSGSNWSHRTYPRPRDQKAHDIVAVSDGGYLMVGETSSLFTGTDIYIIKVDDDGLFDNHLLNGTVTLDANGNCQADNLENGLAGFYIVADGANSTFYSTTDTAGNYSLPLGVGNYEVNIFPPNPFWSSCTNTIQINLATNNDSTNLDFSIQPIDDCPFLEVDISLLSIRRCFPNAFYVNYCNTGTVAANNIYIEVLLDDFMTIDSSSIPISSQVGPILTFDVPNLAYGECDNFIVYYTLDEDCDSTILGETHCLAAQIFADSLCALPAPNWSGADISLSADCLQDSISLSIENIGNGNMDGPLNYVIIEDEVILRQGLFNLGIGGERILKEVANGSTYRLETEQEPDHPVSQNLSVAIEGCGQNDMGQISLGYVTIFPDDDGDPTYSLECRENIGSYDPNDKMGFPTGYGVSHFIEQNESIEYLLRFQNTGTDTAFNIALLDTLSPFLNPASVRPGASSHEYTMTLEGAGVLRFSFNGILLPDSTTNLEGSNGFVKFTVHQQLNNPIGSVIENAAGIYFDFNDPVITNTTIHTVGENYISTGIEYYQQPQIEALVFPNPFRDEVTFELNGNYENLDFELVHLSGKVVRRASFSGNRFLLHKNKLPAGIYIFSIKNKASILSTGKITIL